MDITNVSSERMELAIERFIAGDPLSYHGVDLRVDKKRNPPRLEVSSWSDCIHQENVRREEAKEKIERSKLVAEELAEKSPEFRRVWQTTARHFAFCFDYVTAGLLLAEERDGEIVWRGH
jgi:hypothetical protein